MRIKITYLKTGNEYIQQAEEVHFNKGSIALFGEKYTTFFRPQDEVKVEILDDTRQS